MSGARPTAGAAAGVRPGLRWLGALTAYWFGLSVVWGSITTIVLPRLVEEQVPAAVKTSALAFIAALMALVAILVQPISGAASDRLVTPWGRRRPLMVVGVAAQLLLFAALLLSGQYWAVLGVMLLMEVASNTAQGPYQGLLPDLVPAGQRGLASGFLGAGLLAGQVIGVAVSGAAVAAGRLDAAIVFAGAAVGIGTVVTVAAVDEREGLSATRPVEAVVGWVEHLVHPRRWSGPFRAMVLEVWGRDVLERRDYLWLLASRLAILMATGTLQPFAYYFLEDSIGLGASAGAAVAPLAGLVVVVALLSAVPGGAMTARWGRVRTVTWSALLGAVGAALFAVAPSYASLFFIAVPFGLALGIFLSADWALLADVAPPDEAGRYLGLSNTVTAGAVVLAVAVGGPIADLVNGVTFGWGYRAVFVLAAIEFIVGAWCIRHVREPGSAGAVTQPSSPP